MGGRTSAHLRRCVVLPPRADDLVNREVMVVLIAHQYRRPVHASPAVYKGRAEAALGSRRVESAHMKSIKQLGRFADGGSGFFLPGTFTPGRQEERKDG